MESGNDDSVIFVGNIYSKQNVIILDSDEEETDRKGIMQSPEYYISELKSWINFESLSDWAVVNFKNNIEMIFNKLNAKYFYNNINPEFQIFYDDNNIISDGSAFKILEKSKKILVSPSILIRPRIQQISMILHILIHLFLSKVSKGAIKISHHDKNFRNIMHHINSRINASITFNHKYPYALGEEDYHKHWWACTGNCTSYEPFKGIIRSTIVPNESLAFWTLHHQKCTGSYFKIFEVSKTNSIDETDKKYIRHTCYMTPIPNLNVGPVKEQKAKIPVRIQVDLTNDFGSPVVKNCCEIVDLDESQYELNDSCDLEYFDHFKKLNISMNEGLCAFCFENVGPSRMASHFDFCMGFQNQIHHGIKPIANF